MSQEKLGDAVGLTFQQIQKYSRGHNRIGAGRLWEIAGVLEVPISYFYEGLDDPEHVVEDLSAYQIKAIQLLPTWPDDTQKAFIKLLEAA